MTVWIILPCHYRTQCPVRLLSAEVKKKMADIPCTSSGSGSGLEIRKGMNHEWILTLELFIVGHYLRERISFKSGILRTRHVLLMSSSGMSKCFNYISYTRESFLSDSPARKAVYLQKNCQGTWFCSVKFNSTSIFWALFLSFCPLWMVLRLAACRIFLCPLIMWPYKLVESSTTKYILIKFYSFTWVRNFRYILLLPHIISFSRTCCIIFSLSRERWRAACMI